jgi:putative DNA primase/helicase
MGGHIVTTPNDQIQEAAYKFAMDRVADGFTFKALHPYQDRDGNSLYWRMRSKNAQTGEKQILPIRPAGEGFVLEEPEFSGGKPLYRLPSLYGSTDCPIVLVEGESCVDRLVYLGVVATTSGGANLRAAK